jgi:hypothetical protein
MKLTQTQIRALHAINVRGRVGGPRMGGAISRMVNRLREAGLIEYDGNAPFRLTAAGKDAITKEVNREKVGKQGDDQSDRRHPQDEQQQGSGTG